MLQRKMEPTEFYSKIHRLVDECYAGSPFIDRLSCYSRTVLLANLTTFQRLRRLPWLIRRLGLLRRQSERLSSAWSIRATLRRFARSRRPASPSTWRTTKLRLRCLDLDEEHGRSGNRFAHRSGIGSIILVPQGVGRHILGWYQLILVNQGRNLARPIMLPRAVLYPETARSGLPG